MKSALNASPPALLAAGLAAAALLPCVRAAPPGLRAPAPPRSSTVTVSVEQPYFRLPRWCVGAKLTAYCSDYAGGSYPSDPRRAQRTTPDGQSWLRCLQALHLGFIGASMTRQGRPPNKGKTAPNYDDWRVAAEAVAASGGGVMIETMAGVGVPPRMPNGTTRPPEAADNVDPSPNGEWSVQNCLDWADYMASVCGKEKIHLAEFYNEPATMNSRQLGAHGGAYWYSYARFKNADRLCADWATNHQQDYYTAFKKRYPNAIVCGGSYSDPAGLYNAGEAPRYLAGYPGARVSHANPNTRYQDALSLHCYGYQVPADADPAGRAQALFNSIFYPKLAQPGRVSGYRAGVDQWLSIARGLPGGERNRLVDSEWWAYSPKGVDGWYPAAGADGSHAALADVLGWIVHCQNADRWRFAAIQYHAANVCEGAKPDARGRPTQMRLPDCMFCEYGGKLFRTGRYTALQQIITRFANRYPRLVRCRATGPSSPPGPRNNSSGPQIQACAGLTPDGAALAICCANIGSTREPVTLTWGRPAAGAASAVTLPAALDVETSLGRRRLPFADRARTGLSLTLDGFTAALVEVPLAGGAERVQAL